jgi:NAD(P)-dependent dehydrogenase (short-subunit alcohol dehydrogenase family)
MDLGLRGRVAIVTGGSAGIGLATVRLLLDEGASVAVCGRDRRRLDSLAAQQGAQGGLLVFPADATDLEAMRRFVSETIARFGRLDAVAALAGEGVHGRALDLQPVDWQREIESKVAGVLAIAAAARSHLSDSDAARIVTVTTPAGRDPEPEMAAVSAARAAVANLTRTLALEFADDRIAVNAVAVGLIDTERQRQRYRRAGVGQPYEQWLRAEAERRRIPYRRAGAPEEVARTIVFALSPALSYTSGAVFDVTGGVPGP